MLRLFLALLCFVVVPTNAVFRFHETHRSGFPGSSGRRFAAVSNADARVFEYETSDALSLTEEACKGICETSPLCFGLWVVFDRRGMVTKCVGVSNAQGSTPSNAVSVSYTRESINVLSRAEAEAMTGAVALTSNIPECDDNTNDRTCHHKTTALCDLVSFLATNPSFDQQVQAVTDGRFSHEGIPNPTNDLQEQINGHVHSYIADPFTGKFLNGSWVAARKAQLGRQRRDIGLPFEDQLAPLANLSRCVFASGVNNFCTMKTGIINDWTGLTFQLGQQIQDQTQLTSVFYHPQLRDIVNAVKQGRRRRFISCIIAIAGAIAGGTAAAVGTGAAVVGAEAAVAGAVTGIVAAANS